MIWPKPQLRDWTSLTTDKQHCSATIVSVSVKPELQFLQGVAVVQVSGEPPPHSLPPSLSLNDLTVRSRCFKVNWLCRAFEEHSKYLMPDTCDIFQLCSSCWEHNYYATVPLWLEVYSTTGSVSFWRDCPESATLADSIQHRCFSVCHLHKGWCSYSNISRYRILYMENICI